MKPTKKMTLQEANMMHDEMVLIADSVLEGKGRDDGEAVMLAARVLDLDEHMRAGGDIPTRWATPGHSNAELMECLLYAETELRRGRHGEAVAGEIMRFLGRTGSVVQR